MEVKPALTPERAAELIGHRVRYKATSGDAWEGIVQKPDGETIVIKIQTPGRPPSFQGEVVAPVSGLLFMPYQMILWYIDLGRVESGIMEVLAAH